MSELDTLDHLVTAEAAIGLAVRYHAFQEACEHKKSSAIVCWGTLLLESLAALRLEDRLITRANLEAIVNVHREREREEEDGLVAAFDRRPYRGL